MDKFVESEVGVCRNKEIYLWGAGSILNRSMPFIESICKIKGIFDKNADMFPHGINGYPVLQPEKIVNLPRENTIFLITCIYVGDVEAYLRQAGFEKVCNIFTMFKDNMFRFHAECKGFKEELCRLETLLVDDKSKYILHKIIQYRKNKCCNYSEIYQSNQYFPQDIDTWTLQENEVFIDAGAFVGDTIQAIRERTNNKYDGIFAFEPDKKNFNMLDEFAADDTRIKCYPYAVWNKQESLQFSFEENASSGIDRLGNDSVEAKALDDILPKGKITFIKMDVEGAEYRALQGAERIIKKYKPKLAICVYHKPNDLWEIPFFIKSIVPEYKFYLRHHHKAWFETVLYAVADK